MPDEEKKEIKPNWNTLSFNINKKGEIAFNIPYPASSRENKEIIIEQLKILIKNLEKINENEPEKQFLKIFELKYKENLLIEEIAQKLCERCNQLGEMTLDDSYKQFVTASKE